VFESPQKFIVIDAPTGAGKTEYVRKQVEKFGDRSVLVIAKFISLVVNLSERYNLRLCICETFALSSNVSQMRI
jgi:superfamily II DNA or RNA helicase